MATDAPGSWPRRLGWLLLLWCGGVAAVAVLALAIRIFMQAVGMST